MDLPDAHPFALVRGICLYSTEKVSGNMASHHVFASLLVREQNVFLMFTCKIIMLFF